MLTQFQPKNLRNFHNVSVITQTVPLINCFWNVLFSGAISLFRFQCMYVLTDRHDYCLFSSAVVWFSGGHRWYNGSLCRRIHVYGAGIYRVSHRCYPDHCEKETKKNENIPWRAVLGFRNKHIPLCSRASVFTVIISKSIIQFVSIRVH